MSERAQMTLLTQICGVVSEHTKLVCTKSPKCTQHSEQQKKAIRDQYLSEGFDSCIDNLQVSIFYNIHNKYNRSTDFHHDAR